MVEALPGELPLAGEESDFSGNETESGAFPAEGLLCGMSVGDDVAQLTAKFQGYRVACTVIKDKEWKVGENRRL